MGLGWGEAGGRQPLQPALQPLVAGGGNALLQRRGGGRLVAGGKIGVRQGGVGLRALGVNFDGSLKGQDGLLVLALAQIAHAQVILLLPGKGLLLCAAARKAEQRSRQHKAE